MAAVAAGVSAHLLLTLTSQHVNTLSAMAGVTVAVAAGVTVLLGVVAEGSPNQLAAPSNVSNSCVVAAGATALLLLLLGMDHHLSSVLGTTAGSNPLLLVSRMATMLVSICSNT